MTQTCSFIYCTHTYWSACDARGVLFYRWTQRCVERFGNAHCVTESETHIESRQYIGWWRDAISDAMTSSGHTGERAIHSSNFSAFTKRSHCPSLLRFLTQLPFAIYPFALRRLPQWNFVLLAVKCHGVSPLSTAVHAFHRSRRPTQ